jgi:hypothetical protein
MLVGAFERGVLIARDAGDGKGEYSGFSSFCLDRYEALMYPRNAIGVDKSVPWPPRFARGFTGRFFLRQQAFEIPAKFRLIKRRPFVPWGKSSGTNMKG